MTDTYTATRTDDGYRIATPGGVYRYDPSISRLTSTGPDGREHLVAPGPVRRACLAAVRDLADGGGGHA
jgi:hypothetical protein